MSATETMGKPPTAVPRIMRPPSGRQNLFQDQTSSDPMNASSHHDDLRRDVVKFRSSLTPVEISFLESLCKYGKEEEVKVARQRLNDANLFFREDTKGIGVNDQEGKPQDEGLQGESTLETKSGLDLSITSTLSTGTRRSSAKVQEHLNKRRSSSIHGKLWKAHEGGLAITSNGSRKSVAMRRSSSFRVNREKLIRNSSFLSMATQELLLDGGPLDRPNEDEVFRKSSNSLASGKSRTRATSVGSALNTLSPTLPRSILRPIDIPPPTISHQRILSEGSRRSVSFINAETAPERVVSPRVPKLISDGGLSQSNVSEMFDSDSTLESGPAPGRRGPRRSNSLSSLPSLTLHKAQSLRSDSASVNSIASLHRSDAMRSESESKGTIPSIHRAEPVRSESDSNLSLPSIRRTQAMRSRSDSNLSLPSIRRTQAMRSRSNSNISSPFIRRAIPIRSQSNVSVLTVDEDPSNPAWASPSDESKLLKRHPNATPQSKPILLRIASRSRDGDEGIEVEEIDEDVDNVNKARLYASMLSVNEGSVRTSSSWDDTMDRDKIFRDIRQTISHEDLADFFLGNAKSILNESTTTLTDRKRFMGVDGERSEIDDSWDMNSTEEKPDAWDVLKDEYAVGYGVMELPFRILGTSADDESATPHVLSPPLMESLQQFLPFALSEANFLMKYSLLRDGASLHSLLQHVRGTKYVILALETADGEVFGSFTSEPWRKNWNYYGTGESFLWRMRRSRQTPCHSIIDQASLESELDVFPWTGENNRVQLCTHDTIAVGGGTPVTEKKDETGEDGPIQYGFGISIDYDLCKGTTSHCATFGSPPLCLSHQDDTPFEIVNLEAWTLTPCDTLEEAEKLELGKLFLAEHRQQ